MSANPKKGSSHPAARGKGEPSRAEHAYQRLRAAIQAGELKPGSRLLELELADWLGSSRTPVREALSRLQNEGLITQEPRRGTIVSELDHSMIAELYVMREVLEGTAAGLAARHASDAEIATLREIAQRDLNFENNPARLAANNRVFHGVLYRGAHNRYLLKALDLMMESMVLLGPTTLGLPGRASTAFAEHDAIVSAIEKRDSAAAEAAARAHIRSAYRARLRLGYEDLT